MTVPPPRDHRFYLTQRLESRAEPREDKQGLDQLFQLVYMGSAEYEFGAAPKALREFRQHKNLTAGTHDLTLDGITRTVHFVGDATTLAQKMDDFDYWAHQASPFYAMERTDFPEVFTGTAREWCRTDAWWSLRDCVAWTLDEGLVEKLLVGFTRR